MEMAGRRFKNYAEVEFENWKDRIHKLRLEEGRDVVIFGCGNWGRDLCKNINSHASVNLKGFCDNNTSVQGTVIEGLKVYSPQECIEMFQNAMFIIAVARNVVEIKRQLLGLGIEEADIIVLETDASGKHIRQYMAERLNAGYYLDNECPSEVYIPVIKSNNLEDKRDFRIYLENGLIHTLEKEVDPLQTCGMDQYEEAYGEYCGTESIVVSGTGNTKVKIMIACSHKDLAGLSSDNPEYYFPIQVGKALTDIKMYELCDNVGENISDRNYNYCECSALYWAWKNRFGADADYVGLRHYRRKFDISDEQLSCLKENQVAIVHLDPIYHDNIRNSFCAHTKNMNDWELMKKVIFEKFPEYSAVMEEYENQHFICAYNMSIMRTDLFDKYCEFLFGVLMEIEKYYLQQYDRRDRYLGFLAENLTSIFMMKYKEEKSVVVKLIPIIKTQK